MTAPPDHARRAPLADPKRLAAVRATGLVDAPPSPVLDRLARAATRLLRAPVALVSLVDDCRPWLVGQAGLTARVAAARHLPIVHAFCERVVTEGAPVVVPDAGDPPAGAGASDADLVVGAYLGVPLAAADGTLLGAFCAIDTEPHAWTADDVDGLHDLAAAAASELAMRASVRVQEAAQTLDPRMAWVADAGGQVVHASARCAAYTGFTADGLAGAGWSAAVHPDDREATTRAWRAATDGGAAFDGVYRLRRSDGAYGWVRTHAAPWRDATGAVVRWFGWTEDVQAEVQAEQDQRQLALMARAAVDGLWSWDIRAGRVFQSPRYRELLGYTPAELPDTLDSFYGVLHPEDRPRFDEAVRAHLGARAPFSLELRLRHRDGSWRWFWDRGQAEWDAEGRPVRMAGSLSDVTERHAAEAALRASEARYRALLRHVPDGAVFLVDHDFRFLVADGEALRARGFDPSLIVGRSLYEVLPPNSVEDLAPHYAAALAGETRAFTLESEGRVYEGEAVPICDERQQVVAGMVLTRDVTERAQQAAAVHAALGEARASEARFRAAFDAMPGSMAVIDPATARFLEFNNTACEQLGYSREEFAALAVSDVDASPDRDAVVGMMRAAADPATRTQLRRRHRTKGGDVRDVLLTVREFPAGDGTLQLCTWLDITDQLRAESARAQLDQELRRLLGAMREGVYGVDSAGRITFANAAAAALLGTTVEALVGRRAHATLHHARADGSPYPVAACPIARAVRAGDGARVEGEVFWRADRTPVAVEYTVEPIRDEAGGVQGAVVLFTDVSAREAAAAEREALEAQLRQAQKMEAVGQLAGGVAHDFNNLLTVITGNLEFLRGDLLRELPESHPARVDVAEIAQAAERARALVRQLLTFSRKQPVRPEPLDVGAAVRRAEGLLRRVIGEEIVLAVHVASDGADPGAGAAVVRADAAQLEQVLMNLAVNARDAMLTSRHGSAGRGGTLDIEVDTLTLSPADARAWGDVGPGRWARLRVRDTGHGMDADTQAHAFEPFFTTKPVGQGTGLGLATVFGIVRQAGGGVRVDTAPGRGTTVTILLPLVADDAESPGDGAAPAPHGRAAATVLLVEDEAPVRATARRMLERRGHTVLEARHGADALLVWEDHHARIDAVVTDLRMPELGGRELVARLRARQPDLPVVYVSGYADEGAPAAAGPDEVFVEKPFTGESLVHALAQVLPVARS